MLLIRAESMHARVSLAHDCLQYHVSALAHSGYLFGVVPQLPSSRIQTFAFRAPSWTQIFMILG